MWYLLIIRSLWLNFVFVKYASADWPPSISSTVQLLGLFPDASNTSHPSAVSVQSAAMFKAAIVLSHQYNITIEDQFIGWKVVNTGGNPIDALRNTCLMVSTSNIVGIIGSVFSRESKVIAPFAKTIGTPVISYGATDPELSDRNTYPAFYRTIPSDNAAALAIVKLFIQFNWTSCMIIYQNDAFGIDGVEMITKAFNKNNLTVANTIIFDMAKHAVRGDLESLLTGSSTRLVLVWAEPSNIIPVLQNALVKNVVGPKFTWILSSAVSLDSFNETYSNQLIGMLTIEATVASIANAPINTTLLNAAYDIWQECEPTTFPGAENVKYYALFAFDATWTLIQALEKQCSSERKTNSSCISFADTSFCFDRQFLNSDALFNMINNNTFLGVSGLVEFSSKVTDRISGNYYIAKNVQYFLSGLNYVPVLVHSNADNWIPYPLRQTNVIVWPGNTLIRPNGYAAISDLTLDIALVRIAPYTIVDYVTNGSGETTTQLSGYMIDLIGLLQTEMGFGTNMIVLPSNQSYDDLVDAVANGVYDLVIADMTVTAARSEKVSFSTSIFDNSLRVIIRQSSATAIDLFAYLRPFSSKLWLTLLITTIYAGLLIAFIERSDNEMLQNRSIASLIALSMWYSIGTILGYGVDFYVRTAAGRLLTVGLYILSLISVAAYIANLVSNLTIQKTENIISGIDDIKNGKLSFNRIGIEVGTAVEDYYLEDISGGIRNFFPLKSDLDIYENLLNNKIDAAIMDTGILEYATNTIFCNLTLVGADFNSGAFGIVYQKQWKYAELLDVTILSLREAGSLDNLKSKWFQTSSCSASSQTATSMSVQSMAGLFVTFGVITIIAMLLRLWDKRLVLRDNVLIIMRSKDLFAKQKIFSIKSVRQDAIPHTSNPKLSPAPIVYF